MSMSVGLPVKIEEVIVRLKDNDRDKSGLMIGLIAILSLVIFLCLLIGFWLHYRRHNLHSAPGIYRSIC